MDQVSMQNLLLGPAAITQTRGGEQTALMSELAITDPGRLLGHCTPSSGSLSRSTAHSKHPEYDGRTTPH